MTPEEFKKLGRSIVLALRGELTPKNKSVLDLLSASDNSLKYNGKNIRPDVSREENNYLSEKPDGLYASSAYVTTEASPVGEVIAYMGKTAPNHYLVCDGAEYAIGTYPFLEVFLVEHFGVVNHFGGDGTSTFAVPDLRGEFLRGSGAGSRNSGTGGDVGEHQTPTIHNYIGKESQDYMDIFSTDSDYHTHGKDTMDTYKMGSPRRWFLKNGGMDTESGIDEYTSRPTNTSVLYCIKCEPTWTESSGGEGSPVEKPLTPEEIQAIIDYVLEPKSQTGVDVEEESEV